MKIKKFFKKEIVLLFLIILLFIASSYLSKRYLSSPENFIFLKGIEGVFIFILVIMAAVVIAPFETLPLLPVAASFWGPNKAAFYAIIGWTFGSIIAFYIARVFGEKLVCKFANKIDIDKWRGKLPKKNLFWLVIFARFVLPVDIISYVVGLFTKMPFKWYLLATIIGITPFAFIFSYGAIISIKWQILASITIIIAIFLNYKKLNQYINN
ncbi:TVP38/TMEM64 family protein [Candidatus Parcubacteria bacterium]|nr:TVP38/TMEM64 family protein [Candidatus Parcubacteria bacterium]